MKHQRTNLNKIVNVASNLHAHHQSLEVWADMIGIANLQWQHNSRILVPNQFRDVAYHFCREIIGGIRIAWIAAKYGRLDIDSAVCLAQACTQHYCASSR